MILVSDNLQVTNPVIANAMTALDPQPVVTLVRGCLERGANAIDINSGPLGKGSADKMAFLVKTVQEITDAPLLLDTANPMAMEAGLAVSRKPLIINGFSLEPVKMTSILPLARKYDADIVGYLLNADSSVPMNADERLVIASRLLQAVEDEGIAPEKLIIDPVLVPLTWIHGPFQALEVLTTLKMLPDLFGFPVKSIVGLSNLTSGANSKKKRIVMERIYLPMLFSVNVTLVLMNMFHTETVSIANACNMLKQNTIFSWETV